MTKPPVFSLGLGDLVSQSFSAHFRNILPFTLLATIAMAPWIAVRIFSSTEPAAEAQGWAVAAVVLQMLGGQVLTGAVTYGVVQHLRGEATNLAQTISAGVKVFLRVLGVTIVVALLTTLGYMLCIVPGIILTMRYYVAIPAAVLERKGIGAAMQRSVELTSGSRWQIFGSLVVLGLIMFVPFFVIGFVAATTSGDKGFPMWIEIAVNVLLTPLGSTMAGVCYYLLRSGKENVDAKQIAAVFD